MKYIIFIVVFVGVACANAFSQVALVAHKSVPDAALSLDKILDVYTLNTKTWSDGGKIIVIDIKGDNPAKNKFYAHLGMSYGDMQKIWLKKQFSGKALPPLSLLSEQEVADKIAATPGAVGYISVDKITKDLKILATFK